MLASGELYNLTGFENSSKDGTDLAFNFVLSNGTRSTQKDKNHPTGHTHMIPEDALKKTRRVTIHHAGGCITGFSFFDKDGQLLWKIGMTYYSGETVLIAENEVIVGVVAKMYNNYQTRYSDFQFVIAAKRI